MCLGLFLVGSISRISFQTKRCNLGWGFSLLKLLINLTLGWCLIKLLFSHVAVLKKKSVLFVNFQIILSSSYYQNGNTVYSIIISSWRQVLRLLRFQIFISSIKSLIFASLLIQSALLSIPYWLTESHSSSYQTRNKYCFHYQESKVSPL